MQSSITVSPTAASLVSDQHSLIRDLQTATADSLVPVPLTPSSPTAVPVIALRRRRVHRPLLQSSNDRRLTYIQQLRPWSLCVAVFTILRLTRSRTAVKRLVITVQRFFSDASTCLKHSTGYRLARKRRSPDDATLKSLKHTVLKGNSLHLFLNQPMTLGHWLVYAQVLGNEHSTKVIWSMSQSYNIKMCIKNTFINNSLPSHPPTLKY